MDIKNLKSFLNYGYFMDFKENKYPLDFSKINKSLYTDYSEKELIDIGIKFFHKAIEKDFKPGQTHVVPLSGGLDSRGVLAGLLEFTEAKNIYTYTFGTPGTLDYDIGKLVAKKAGTNHKNFPLTSHRYKEEELIDISNRVENQTMLFHHPPVWEVDNFCGENSIVWSGFIGDVVAGGHLPKKPIPELIEAKINYVNNYKYVNSLCLSNESNKNFIEYLEYDFLDKDILSYEEQLVFYERTKKLTAPHVLMEGYNYATPFINNQFMDFLLSLDNKYRRYEYLFIEIMMKAFPKLFSIKTKTTNGLNLRASYTRRTFKKGKHKIKKHLGDNFKQFTNPYINYLDFKKGIREREDLKKLFRSNIADLKSRNVIDWIDEEELFTKHLKKEKDYSDALIVLTSLEIHFKAQDQSND